MRISKDEIAGEKYLLVQGKDTRDQLLEKMLKRNGIKGFLVPDVLEIGDEVIYRYRISGMESLYSYHERRHMNPSEILYLLQQLAERLMQAEDYLISKPYVLVNPEQIYLSEQEGMVLCCCMEEVRDSDHCIVSLVQFLLKWMSPGSKSDTKRIYWIYEELQKGTTTFFQIMEEREEPADVPIGSKVEEEEKKRWYRFFCKERKNRSEKDWNEEEEQVLMEGNDETVALDTELLESRELIHYLKRIGQEVREEIPIYRYPATIGKSEKMDLVISVPTVSGRHAQLQKEGDEIWVRDLGSLNGTFVNDLRVHDPIAVKSGDRVRFADQEYFFE